MILTDFRTTLAWHNALDLGPHLVRIAEQLPEGELAGLSAALRQLAIDVPGAVASDLVTGSQVAMVHVLRAVAALEVIERVYPALDTAEARTTADALAERIGSGNFTELVVPPAPPADPEIATEAVQPAPEAAGTTAAAVTAMPSAPADGPVDPTTVPVIATFNTPPTPGTPDDVYPNSPQQTL